MMDFWIEHHRPRRGNPLWLPLLFVIARIVRGCPYCSWLPVLFVVIRNQGRHRGLPLRSTPRCPFVVGATPCGCPFVRHCPFCGAKSGQARGPAPTVNPALGQPPVVARFIRRRGNPLWLPVCSPLPVLWCQIRAGTGACPYGPPRVGATPCGCPFVRRSTKSGQARGPAHTVQPP